ncbi:MAG: translesion error-prone DNA polymerase V autoproteolytic subunit, partial [Pseudomonadota bacterium]|nr:translesion error-prone DNA polymerase V autoproteolytic subunit [Pseudomonadota bacterium]
MMDSVLIGDVHPLSFNMPRRYVPCLTSKVVAGFPSPADDHIEKYLDLNEHLVIHPQATFMLRVSGWSMRDAGIFDGDEIIVDRAISPEDGHVVVAIVNGEMTVKRLSMTSDGVCLMAAHPDFQPIGFQEGEELVIWGVVTRVLHKV